MIQNENPANFADRIFALACLEGFEPPTFWFAGRGQAALLSVIITSAKRLSHLFFFKIKNNTLLAAWFVSCIVGKVIISGREKQ